MSAVSDVVARVEAGEKIRFRQDFYGRQWVELTRGRLLRRRSRIELSAQDILQIKTTLARRKPENHAS
jgi:chorismate-pyruvate lyase